MPRSSKPLSAIDAAWARMDEAGNAADILVLMRFAGTPDQDELKRLVQERVLTHPHFSQRVVEPPRGWWRPRWAPSPCRIEDHLLVRQAPRPGSDAQLRSLISELMSTPFDPAQSPWRLWLIDGLENGSVLVGQLHHCLGDGFALLRLLLTLTEEHDELTSSRRSQTAARPSTSRPTGHTPPSSSARRVLRGLRDLGRILALPFDQNTQLRRPLSGRRCVAWTPEIPLSAVRAAAHARGCTVNDFLLGVLSGALRRHLQVTGAIESLRAVVPVNLRGHLATSEEHLGNYFGLVFLDLPVEEPSTQGRFVSIKRQMDRLKASQEAFVTLRLLRLVGEAPLVLARQAIRLFARKASFVVSNVPGPPQPLSLAGERIVDLMFWAPHPQGLGCGASIISYAGTLRVGIRTDAAVLPHPQVLADAVVDELDAALGVTPPLQDVSTSRAHA